MEAYGIVEGAEEPIGLASLALSLSPDSMRAFASFVAAAAAEMERLGPAFDHVHWRDHPGWNPAWPDVQLTKVYGETS